MGQLLERGLIDRFSALDVATIYEAAGQKGMVDPAVRPAWRGARLCGPALTVLGARCDNLALHRAVVLAQPGDVIVAGVENEMSAGAWGEILTVAAQVRGIAGLAIDGAVRDIEAIEGLGFPIFSRGLAIGACTKKAAGVLNGSIEFGGVPVRPGDLIFGDADGLVVVDRDSAETVYAAALARRNKERGIIENLRKGKTTLELLGLEGS